MPRALRRLTRTREGNTVLFPARMGIVHKGHIEFVARLLELGYFVRVSLQHSYTITKDDPFPKWLVRKMVARCLLARGFTPDDFEIVLTPMMETRQEMRLHFAMSPGWKDVIAVASGNPDVHTLFPGLPFLTQRSVFGVQGEEYQTRSWGERLRRAVREGDQEAFENLAASGVEEILTLSELREQDAAVPVEFVRGRVVAHLHGEDKLFLHAGVRRHEHPEEALVRTASTFGHRLELVDQYVRDTQATLDGRPICMRYESMRMEGDDQIITYRVAVR